MNRFIDMTIPTVFQNFVIFANLGDEVIAIDGLCLNGMSDLEAYTQGRTEALDQSNAVHALY